MKDYTFAILDYCHKHDIVATIFTTGHLITKEIAEKLDKYGHNLRLFIKYNSSKPEIQDELVRVKGYTKLRNKVIRMLISKGFNDGRLGVVTSVMPTNYEEMPSILRFARNNKINFDTDTIIWVGRGDGSGCDFEPETVHLLQKTLKQLQKIDKEEYGHEWDIIPTYVGSSPCTRFEHHLHIRNDGVVKPCIGADKVILGNTRKQSLKKIWDSKITKIIRSHNYKGKCPTCKNYQEHKCYSCLGRSTANLTTEFLKKHGYVKTIGCWNYNSDEKNVKNSKGILETPMIIKDKHGCYRWCY